MHAHRCEACMKSGKEVVWIHPEADFAQVAAHKCPECGTINWKQSKLDNGKLPQPQPKNENKWETALGYVLAFVAIALVGYAGYLYIQKRRAEKTLPL
jgi:hypothetical protein